MSTTNSTLDLFALKSFVSVLPETNKETALRIVGGGDNYPEDYDPDWLGNICDPDRRDEYEDWFDWMEELGEEWWLEVDEFGNVIDVILDKEDLYRDENFQYLDREGFRDFPCEYA